MRYFILFTVTVAVFAKTPSKLELSKNMLDVMNKNGYVDLIIKNVVADQISQNPLLSPNRKVVEKFASKYLSFKALKPELTKIYANELSSEEIKAFTDFCKTSAGQKILLKLPRLINISSYIAQKRVLKYYPQLINSVMKK